ncbi:MAG TPA: 4-hydroxy-tetrahydrodipicolinate reductase [bacterium]|nr:4-hydroxy-tetrahydrodipicolinate reductase [bacterium]
MSADRPRIVLSGIYGRMGQALAPLLLEDPRVELVGGLYAPHQEGDDNPFRASLEARGVELDSSPIALLNLIDGADLLLDFSNREGIRSNLESALHKGLNALVGVTGFDAEEQRWLQELATQTGRTIWWVPNFSLGMALMNRMAVLARRYLGAVEILELHHDRKLDAPSGSARHTAQLLAETGAAEGAAGYTPPVVEESSPSVTSARFAESRGMAVEGIPIHSVRLPGLLAHQQIMFGGTGETLTIRHDTLDRSAFVEGVIRAALYLPHLRGFHQGIELLLEDRGN